MAISHVQPLLLLLCSLFLLPALRATSFHYCDKRLNLVNVKGVEISPDPVVSGKAATFKISGVTGEDISGGEVVIKVSLFGIPVHTETHDLCEKTACPIAPGSFVLSHSQTLPSFTPPGTYTLKMTINDKNGGRLTCISFKFKITSDSTVSARYIKGKDTLIRYEYPWLPNKCSLCTKWGHLAKVCTKSNPTETPSDVVDTSVAKTQATEPVHVAEKSAETAQTNKPVTEMAKLVPETDREIEVEAENITTGSNEGGEWTAVPPGKAGRSPDKTKKTLEFGQVSILSKSQFAVLSPSEEEEGEIVDTTSVTEESENTNAKDITDSESGQAASKTQATGTQPTTTTQTQPQGTSFLRQSLPRESKDNHKVLNSNAPKHKDVGPTGLSKKAYKRKL